MELVQITMQKEAAHETVKLLQKQAFIQFEDQNGEKSSFQRTHSKQVKRCEELERSLRYFSKQIEQSEIFQSRLEKGTDKEFNINELEQNFRDLEKDLRDSAASLEKLRETKTRLEELNQVILQGEEFIRLSEPTLGEEGIRQGSLGHITGVIARDKVQKFLTFVFRATRGNMIPRLVEIKEPLYDPIRGTEIEKNVFIIFFNATSAFNKIQKICESMNASIHKFPEGDLNESRNKIISEIGEVEGAIQTTLSRRNDTLSKLSIDLADWEYFVLNEKIIYHTMNLFEYLDSNLVVAVGWIPSKYLEKLNDCLSQAVSTTHSELQSSVSFISTTDVPPTYFEMSDFTQSFQQITNAYGIPSYKEINPAVFSFITFPFLFAVMFGDLGHGFVLFLFGLSLLVFSKQIKPYAESNEMLGMVFSGRHVICLMGVFSTYTGLLYNDCFSLALNLFGTAYSFDEETLVGSKVRRTYPFGVDPAWFGTSNKLGYYNSMKMKISIVYGVAHMLLGIFLSLFNHIQFKHISHIIFEFIPEVLILVCTFGYLAIMIIVKWNIDWVGTSSEPPSLLNTMTDFFLSPWTLKQPPLYTGQFPTQLTLLLIAGISVPMLLFPIPILTIIKNQTKKRSESNGRGYDQVDDEIHFPHEGEEESEDDSWSEIFIKQLIHTIEFVLGCVSNTASYLRLWALSLAHAQLSEVFWTMSIGLVLGQQFSSDLINKLVINTGIGFFVTYFMWALLTVGVLLGMECLSAFLHTLRLHWVEHQNKYFEGLGTEFTPICVGDPSKAKEE